MNDHRKDCSAKNLRTTSHVKPTFRFLSGYEDADIAAKAGLDVAISNMRFPVSDLSTNCVLKNGNNCETSVHQIKFTVCNRPLVAVLVRHWAATTHSSSTVFELVIQDLQILISWRRESASMWSLPFSAHSQALFGRLHPLQCSTSEIFWSGHTQGRFWKCCISQHHRLC